MAFFSLLSAAIDTAMLMHNELVSTIETEVESQQIDEVEDRSGDQRVGEVRSGAEVHGQNASRQPPCTPAPSQPRLTDDESESHVSQVQSCHKPTLTLNNHIWKDLN